uniref:Uncharacterized protein n=1 Tax=Anguilla anguilla TaxID=7936 RepID=A0A0E9Q502_ANGAN
MCTECMVGMFFSFRNVYYSIYGIWVKAMFMLMHFCLFF